MKIFLLAFACLALIFPSAGRAETLTFVADQWCPYNCEPDSEKPGYIVEILSHAFSKHGYLVRYKNVPWTRAIEETRSGKHTGIIGTSYTNTPDFVFPAQSQGNAETNFYVAVENEWRYEGLDSLKNVALGVIADYLYMDELDAYIEKNKDNPALVQIVAGDNALEMNLKKLVSGRITATLEDPYVVGYTISLHPELEGKIISAGIIPGEESGSFVGFSPKNPKSEEYAKILSEEMDKMRANGELDKILNRYGLTDWHTAAVTVNETVPAAAADQSP